MRLWGGRFDQEKAGKGTESFTPSIDFDRRLYRQDLRGSRAHARMLGRVGVLTQAEVDTIVGGLEQVGREIEAGEFVFRRDLEDIHLNIEARLTALVGDVGKKLHTARSRNDQVALDMHLYAREQVVRLSAAVTGLQATILGQAELHVETLMPGYTHLQRAQPVTLGYHLMAYFWMLERDQARLEDAGRRSGAMPLGACALAGTSFPIDPAMVAEELGFDRLYDNGMDAVSDRDYLVEIMSGCGLIMAHLSRLGEELVLWSSHEFGFAEFDDAYATGSSIMPQKKNPDVAELVRGKSGRVFGHLLALLTVLKGLPLAYHTDMQEDKEAFFDTVDTTLACLGIMAEALGTITFKADRMAQAVRGDYSNATDLADHLVQRGLPFREAHEVVGRIVGRCAAAGRLLAELTADELAALHPLLGPEAVAALDPARGVAARKTPNGPAPERVRQQIDRARGLLEGRAG